MQDDSSATQSRKGGCGVFLIAGLVAGAVAAAGSIAYLLSHTGGDRAALDAYVAAARSGKSHAPVGHADADTTEATELLATSTNVDVRNFKKVYGTSCWTADVDAPKKRSVPIDFFLVEQGDVWRVADVSIHRECNCVRSGPRAEQGCAMSSRNSR